MIGVRIKPEKQIVLYANSQFFLNIISNTLWDNVHYFKFIEVKQHVIKRVYDACARIAEEYVRHHRNDWRLGGDETIVLIDLYPDGCSKISGSDPEYQNNNPTQILCIAEAKVTFKKILHK